MGVFPSVVWRRTDDLAFNFRNAEGPVDPRGALIVGVTYTALPYPTQALTRRAEAPLRPGTLTALDSPGSATEAT